MQINQHQRAIQYQVGKVSDLLAITGKQGRVSSANQMT